MGALAIGSDLIVVSFGDESIRRGAPASLPGLGAVEKA